MSRIEFFDTICALDRSQWDGIVGDNVFASYGWLKTIEDIFSLDAKQEYVIL